MSNVEKASPSIENHTDTFAAWAQDVNEFLQAVNIVNGSELAQRLHERYAALNAARGPQ